jgi:hypothetical protein
MSNFARIGFYRSLTAASLETKTDPTEVRNKVTRSASPSCTATPDPKASNTTANKKSDVAPGAFVVKKPLSKHTLATSPVRRQSAEAEAERKERSREWRRREHEESTRADEIANANVGGRTGLWWWRIGRGPAC